MSAQQHVVHLPHPPLSPVRAVSFDQSGSVALQRGSSASRPAHLALTVPPTPSSASASSSSAMSASSPSPSSSSGYRAGSGLAQVSALAANQLLTRGLTFAMNLYVARAVGPVAFGLQAIHLYLLNTIVLFLAREPNRKATIRYASAAPASAFASSTSSASSPASSSAPSSLVSREVFELQQVVNLSWLCIGLAVPLAALLSAWFIRSAPAEAVPLGYVRCVVWYGVASVVELLCEPLFVIANRRLLVGCRVWIDSAATLTRCLVTVLAIAVWDCGLLAFAYGQLAFAAFYSAAFYAYFLYHIQRGNQALVGVASIAQLLPVAIPSKQRQTLGKQLTASPSVGSSVSSALSAWLDADLVVLYGWLLVQMVEKLALTEGEKAVMVTFHFSLDQQGVYGLVQNLGSLVARLLFAPLEEASGTEFSLLFAQANAQHSSEPHAVDAAAPDREPLLSPTRCSPASAPVSASAAASSSSAGVVSAYTSAVLYLGVLLKLLCCISGVLVSFGPPYSFLFLDLLYGSKWSRTDAPQVLAAFCLYIAFMALNGLSEAFVTAVTTSAQMKVYNALLLAFSAIYLTACAALLRYGALGLIAANCLNMTLRIAYSAAFSHRFFSRAKGVDPHTSRRFPRQIVASAAPSPAVAAALLASAAICHASQRALGVSSALSTSAAHSSPVFLAYASHVAVGVACLSSVAWLLWRDEQPFLTQLYALTVNTRSKRKKVDAATPDGSKAM